MVKRVSAAGAKAHLSALMAEVAYGGKRVIVERRGKPVAALVSVEDAAYLERSQATSDRPRGALALVGAWKDAGDERLDQVIADIYAARERDTGRLVELEE